MDKTKELPKKQETPTEQTNELPPASLASRLRPRFVAGLVLVVPIWITFFVIRLVFQLLRNMSLWLVEAILLTPLGAPLLSTWGLNRAQLAKDGLADLPLKVHWCINVLCVVLTIALVYLLGWAGTNVAGKRMIRLAEKLVAQVPLVKVVYSASKKVLESFAGEGTHSFQRVVLAPFPTKDVQSVAFVTRAVQDSNTGETLYTLFVAMAPHLTSGFVFVIPAKDVIELNWSIEQALKVIISAGMLTPDAVTFFPSSVFKGGD